MRAMTGRRRGTALVAGALGLVLVLGACAGESGPNDEQPAAAAEGGSSTSIDATPVVDPAEVPADPSAGCGAAADVAPGQEQIDTTVEGAEVPDRWYLRFVPTAHDGETPVPVVLDLHGYSEGALVHVGQTGLGEYGEEQGFVTVMPNGAGPVPRWLSTPGSEDVTFLSQVLDEVETSLCVDRNRIYVTGLSNGAFMTSVLMCELSDRVAAAAPVAGIQPVEGCEPTRAVPVVTFHGTDDPFVSFDGGIGPAVATLPTPDGTGTLGELEDTPEAQEQAAENGLDATDDAPTVPEITARWAERNGCAGEPTESPVGTDVVQVAWTCPGGQDVVLYRIEGGGHTWPGSPFMVAAVDLVGTTTTTIDANQVIWDFFQAHPLGISG